MSNYKEIPSILKGWQPLESIRKRRLFLTNWGKLPTNKKGTKELIKIGQLIQRGKKKGSYNGIGYSLKKKSKKKREKKKKEKEKKKEKKK